MKSIIKSKIIKASIIIFIFIISICNISFSADEEKEIVQIQGIETRAYTNFKASDYKPDSQTNANGASEIAKKGNVVVKVIQVIGSAISVITLIVIAIKYILGSVEEKAEYKKTMVPYLVGCFMVFGISNLLGIIIDIVSSMT